MMPRLVAAWSWTRGRRLHLLAGVFAGGEAVVECGIPLPFSDSIGVHWRLLFIGSIVALSYYLRWRADQEKP